MKLEAEVKKVLSEFDTKNFELLYKEDKGPAAFCQIFFKPEASEFSRSLIAAKFTQFFPRLGLDVCVSRDSILVAEKIKRIANFDVLIRQFKYTLLSPAEIALADWKIVEQCLESIVKMIRIVLDCDENTKNAIHMKMIVALEGRADIGFILPNVMIVVDKSWSHYL